MEPTPDIVDPFLAQEAQECQDEQPRATTSVRIALLLSGVAGATLTIWKVVTGGARPAVAGAATGLSAVSDANSTVTEAPSVVCDVCGTCITLLALSCIICCLPVSKFAESKAKYQGPIAMVLNCGIFWYYIFAGVYSDFWQGVDIGLWCKFLCIWATVACCCCGCLNLFILAPVLIVGNMLVKQMKRDYEEKVKLLSAPRRDYYESDLFRAKCDRLFDDNDTDKSGNLDMEQLRNTIETLVAKNFDEQLHRAQTPEEHEQIQGASAALAVVMGRAFDQGGTSKVNKPEFVEMMKFFSVSMLQAGQFTAEQAFEILQMDEQTATMQDISKQYRKMAIKFHPDKRHNVSPEIAQQDMQEINDAKAKLEEHFGKNAPASEGPAAVPLTGPLT